MRSCFYRGDNMSYEKVVNMFEHIIIRQNAMLDMLDGLSRAFAKQNNLAIEQVQEECEYINAIEGFDK